MKNSTNILFSIALLVAVSSCKDKVEPTTGIDFDITFKATYDGNQLEKNKDYQFGTYPLYFVRYRLYLSDITLLKEDGTEVQLSEVEYLDFTPDAGASDLSVTPTFTFKNVPEGLYSGIRMGYGVNPANNAKKPSDFAAGTPLNIETDYWPGWESYIFSVLDGKADPDNDGTKNLAFSYHCGSDPVYRIYTFNKDIHVEQGHAGLGIEFDVLKLLTNDDGSLYDIESKPNTSNDVGNTAVAAEIMNRYDDASFITE